MVRAAPVHERVDPLIVNSGTSQLDPEDAGRAWMMKGEPRSMAATDRLPAEVVVVSAARL